MKFELSGIPDGELGTDLTVDKIGQLVNASLLQPIVRIYTLNLLNSNNYNSRSQFESASIIFNHIKRYIRFIRDPYCIETIQAPEITLNLKYGDCDDQAALMAAMALSIGIPARFRVTGQSPDKFQHIFTELLIGGEWTPADTSEMTSLGERIPRQPYEKIYYYKG